MNYEKIRDLSTVVANLGVLIGLLVVIVEINQNTQATEAQVTWEHNNAVRELYFPVVFAPVFSDMVVELRSLDSSEVEALVSSNDARFTQYSLWFAIQMNMWEARYFTQPSNIDRERLTSVIVQLLSGNEMDKYLALTVGLARFRPEFREFWESIRQSF